MHAVIHAADIQDRDGGVLVMATLRGGPGNSDGTIKWSVCLTAGYIGPRFRRDDEQETAPEPHTGLQG